MKVKSGYGDFSGGGPYLALLLFFAATSTVFSITLKERSLLYLAGAQAAAAIVCFLAVLLSARLYRRRVMRMMDSITRYLSIADDQTLSRYPVPVAVVRLETEELIWSNDKFIDLINGRQSLQDKRLTRIVEGFSVRWLME